MNDFEDVFEVKCFGGVDCFVVVFFEYDFDVEFGLWII